MSAKIINGNAIAKEIQSEITEMIKSRIQCGLRVPGLAVIMVGENPASKIYVKKKCKICQDLGIVSKDYLLDTETTEMELLSLIDSLNADREIDGILVQLPLPNHLNPNMVIERIYPTKDVDGFHPYNLGRLATGRPLLSPCTPRGVMKLIESTKINLVGLDAVVIGASNIVGKPMAMELSNAKTTVTICRSSTRNLPKIVRGADIVVAATGVTQMVKKDWIKPGAIVIDVGITRSANGKLVGDVDFDEVSKVADWITPVPGGVGPLTVAILMKNTLAASEFENPFM